MRVPDEWLDAVFFLGVKRTSGSEETIRFGGTGFCISVPNEFGPATLRRLYLVTDRHNIEAARDAGNLWIRVNTREDSSVLIETDPWELWTFHEDERVDLAVASPDGLGAAFYYTMSQEMILTEEDAQAFDFGVGSELLTIGLFANREGQARNVPVLRTGIVSAMPGEPIADGTPHSPYVGYLAEILSMGGMSGSPVYFHPTRGTKFPRVSYYLVGLIRSHWDERPPGAPFDLPRHEWVNRGIAGITPATRILEMLGIDMMKQQRRRDAEALVGERGAVLDSHLRREPDGHGQS
jgi:hypothetical protein